MQNLVQQRPYWLAVQNTKNDLRDFDEIPELLAGALAEIFLDVARKFTENTIILGVREKAPPKKFCKITLKYTHFSVLWNHFKNKIF